MKLSLRRNVSGFTIIELLIVIVVIAILAGLVLTTFAGVQERARDTERRTDINSIATQLEVYYNDNGHYLSGSTAADTCGATDDQDCALTTATLDGIDADALVDPQENDLVVGAIPASFTDADDYRYFYDVTGATCTTEQCDSFSLGSYLEQDDTLYQKDSLN